MAVGWPFFWIFACFSLKFDYTLGSYLHKNHPTVKSVAVINESRSVMGDNTIVSLVYVEMSGVGFSRDLELRLTTVPAQKGSECTFQDSDLFKMSRTDLLWHNSTAATFRLEHISPDITYVFSCLKMVYRTESNKVLQTFGTPPNEVIKWHHQGTEGKIIFPVSSAASTTKSLERWRGRRSDMSTDVNITTPGTAAPPVAVVVPEASLYGLRVEDASASWELVDGTPELLMGSKAVLRLFGRGFSRDMKIVLTSDSHGEAGDHCEFPAGKVLQVEPDEKSEYVATVKLSVPEVGIPGTRYRLCYKVGNASRAAWTLFGSEPHQCIQTYTKVLPLWASIIIIMICLTFSSLFSGLNLGLMSIEQTDLKIIANTGTETERKYANAISPIRRHGNYLLCSILLGNVMVNSTFTILLDDLTSGIIAIVASTLMIVVFGEITPQAICSRHGLAVGAKTIVITKLVMLVTAPLSYPISKILDKVLGEEIGAVFTRERLKELVKLNPGSNIKTDELNIISGVLELTEKKVCDVMTRIEDVFMLSIDSVLDFDTVSGIRNSGFSRIPVYDTQRTNIVTVLFVKDLALVDPDDNLPIKTLCEFYQNVCFFVFEDTPLDIIFKQFKEGSKGHMAFVHRVNNEGEGDPFYETVGIVTLEDVIEELIQSEIVDETDVYTDNRSKRKRTQKQQDFTEFAEMSESQKVHISPQLALATFQFLTTTVDPFKSEYIDGNVLKRVLKQNVFYHIKIKNKDTMKEDPSTIIYDQGKAADYFVLILEGRVEVTVGKEGLIFESGPFTYFGTQALVQNVGVAESPSGGGAGTVSGSSALGSLQSVVQLDSRMRNTFVPDYSVRAVTEVFYLKLNRSLYLAAKRASLMQWRNRGEETSANNDALDDVFEKLMHTYDADDSKSQGTPEVTRTCSQVSTRASPMHNGSLVMTSSEPSLQHIPGDHSTRDLKEECAKLLQDS